MNWFLQFLGFLVVFWLTGLILIFMMSDHNTGIVLGIPTLFCIMIIFAMMEDEN
jgi:hypothetical protein